MREMRYFKFSVDGTLQYSFPPKKGQDFSYVIKDAQNNAIELDQITKSGKSLLTSHFWYKKIVCDL